MNYISFQSKPTPPKTPSLACRLGLEGSIRYLKCGAVVVTAEDNPEQRVEVFIVRKRELHVITDQMLRARASMEEDNVYNSFNLRRAYA